MAHQIPTSEPTELRAGDTWQWRREDLSDYPASDGWELAYSFRNADNYFDFSAAADGDNFAVNVAASTTVNYVSGLYTWAAFVRKGGERYEVDSGVFTVKANFPTAAPFDARSQPRILLDAVNAILEGRASNDQMDIVNAAAGDENAARTPTLLWRLRAQLTNEVKRLEGTGGGLRRITARFH